jgi:hypothetical protein
MILYTHYAQLSAEFYSRAKIYALDQFSIP